MKRPNQRANLSNLKKLKSQGIDVPSLDQAPVLLPEAEPYMAAYEILASRRPPHQPSGPVPIAMSEIWAYVQLNGMTDDAEIDDLVRFVVMLDCMSCDVMREQIRKAQNR